MKKLTVFVLAIVAMLAFGSIAANAAPNDSQKFDSEVSLKFVQSDPTGPYDQKASAFKGQVKSTKELCEKKRKVVVRRLGEGKVGTVTTSNKGSYRVAADDPFVAGEFKARVKKKIIEKQNGKEIICVGAKSDVIQAP